MFLPQFATDRNLLFAALFLTVCGCASTTEVRTQRAEIDALKKQLGDMKDQVGTMDTRVSSVEGKLTTQPVPVPSVPTAPAHSSTLKSSGVTSHPSEGIGSSPEKVPAASEPEPGFVNDEAVQEFRRAMLLFEAGRYGDSSVSFSSFLERFPDHPFAGAAQFYVAKSYFKQNQFTQAYDEYQRVLTTYDRSSHVTETLRDLAETEDKLHKTQDAARHRHLLSSLFPQSPAHASVASARPARASAPAAPAVPSTGESLSGESVLKDIPAQKQVEEIAGEKAPSLRKSEPVRPTPGTNASQLDPPPTAPVERVHPAPKAKPAPKPGDIYPATEDKS